MTKTYEVSAKLSKGTLDELKTLEDSLIRLSAAYNVLTRASLDAADAMRKLSPLLERCGFPERVMAFVRRGIRIGR